MSERRHRVIRTLVFEGSPDWVQATLDRSWLCPSDGWHLNQRHARARELERQWFRWSEGEPQPPDPVTLLSEASSMLTALRTLAAEHFPGPPPHNEKTLKLVLDTHIARAREILARIDGKKPGRAEGDDPDEEELPACAVAMGCLCAGHARGNPAAAPCDTTEV